MKTTLQNIILAPFISFVLIFTINAAAQQQPDTDFKSQAFKLAGQGDVAQMKALLDKHPEVATAKDERGGTPLHAAILAGSAPLVELLLAKGADVTAGDWESPAVLAVEQTNIVITRLVLERVTDINARYRTGATLLHIAAQAHNTKAAELLLARGASLQLGDKSGYTPVDVASGAGGGPAHHDVVALLQREAEARGKIKRNIAGTWTGKYQNLTLTLTLDLAQNVNIRLISDSGAVVRTIQAQYHVNYAKRPALLEFYRIASPGFEEGQSLWAMIEFTAADMLVFEWLKDYTGKAGEIAPEFFGSEAVILKRGALKTGAKAREPEQKAAAGTIEVQGMKLPKDSLIEKYPSGKISRIVLSQDAEIQSVRCLQRTSVEFYMNGNIKTANLATDQTIQGLPCAGGEVVDFYESGKIQIFKPAKNVTIYGLMYLAREQVKLYENGTVEYGDLAQDTEYQGGRFKKGQQITLTRSGKIENLYLAKDTEIQKVWCLAMTSAHFSDAGKLNTATLAKDQTLDGTSYAGKTLITFFDSGKVSDGILAKDAPIQGFPCAASNKVSFNKNGSFAACTLAKDYAMFGITVPAKSGLDTDSAKRWKIIPATPFTFKGTTYAPGTHLQFQEGRLREFKSPTAATVQGIVCAMNTPVAFRDSGKLQRCTLATKQVLNGLMLSGGQEISLYESGKLQVFMLTAESGVKGVRFEQDFFVFETDDPKLGQIKTHLWPGVKGVKLNPEIWLHESGSLELVGLAEDATLAGIKCLSRSHIFWYDSGKIKSATLAEAQTIQGIPCAKNGKVYFSTTGILYAADLGEDAVIAGIKCAKNTPIWRYDSGKIKSATLAKAQTIAGQLYAKGECLHFLKSGMVESTAAAREHYVHFFNAAVEDNDDQALAALGQAIAVCPSYIEARTHRVQIWLKRKDLNLAMSEIAAILQYDPTNLFAHVSSATIHEMRGKADSAIADCNKALNIDSQCAIALKVRGDMLMTKKKYSLALADLNKAVELSPDNDSYRNSLAWVLATCAESKYRNGQRAVELAEKSVRTVRNANYLDTLAAAYAEAGRFNDAVKTQQEVIKVAGKNHPELEDFNKRLDWYRQKEPWRQ